MYGTTLVGRQRHFLNKSQIRVVVVVVVVVVVEFNVPLDT